MKILNSQPQASDSILKIIEKEFWIISPNYNGATISGLLKCTLRSLIKKGKIENYNIKKIEEYVIEFTITYNLNGKKVIEDAHLRY